MVKVIEAYFEGKKKDFECQFDEKSRIRPAWIKLVNAETLPKFIKVWGNDKTFHYYRHKFGGYFLPLNISLGETKLFYERVASEFDQMTEYNNKQFGSFIVKKLLKNNVPKDKIILDVCAGTGVQSQLLIESGYKDISLLDFSAEMLAQAKRKKVLSENAKFILADLTKFSSNKKYNIIVSSMGLHYFDNYIWKNVLDVMKSVLEKNGMIIVIEDNKRGCYPKSFQVIEEGSVIINLKNGKKSAKFFFVLKKN